MDHHSDLLRAKRDMINMDCGYQQGRQILRKNLQIHLYKIPNDYSNMNNTVFVNTIMLENMVNLILSFQN